jgi:hypothetical protein
MDRVVFYLTTLGIPAAILLLILALIIEALF